MNDPYTPEEHARVENIMLDGIMFNLNKQMLAKYGMRKLKALAKDQNELRKARLALMLEIVRDHISRTRAAYNAPTTDTGANTFSLGRHDELIAEWLGRGLSHAQIARKFGVERSTLSRHIKAHQIQPKAVRMPSDAKSWGDMDVRKRSNILERMEAYATKAYYDLDAKYPGFVDRDDILGELHVALAKALHSIKIDKAKPTTYLHVAWKNAVKAYRGKVLKAIEEQAILARAQNGFAAIGSSEEDKEESPLGSLELDESTEVSEDI